MERNVEIERYNRFRATMLIRHSADGKKYLYDIQDIKKKRATLSAHYELTRIQGDFLCLLSRLNTGHHAEVEFDSDEMDLTATENS